jgi:ABC-type lipoprotein export system ATPase subunit
MNSAAYERLFDLLERSSLDEFGVDAVLAAADSPEALTALLDGERRPLAREPVHRSEPAPELVFLEQIAVEGFRGIGERARLQFEPGRGLTLIVGRNGSGKSSFAEAFEVLLTGTTLRWEERTKVWREGWRSLHHDGPTEISATFRVDGERQPLIISRRWPAGAPLEAGEPLTVSGPRSDWAELGWERPLEQFRPILSYTELGTMFSTRAAALYEALSAVLGLEDFDAILAVLRRERLAREKTAKEEKQVRASAVQLLASFGDPPASELLQLLSRRAPDIDAVWSLAQSEEHGRPHADAGALATLPVRSLEHVTSAFADATAAAAEVAQLQTADVDRMDALAKLMGEGLAFHRAHGRTLREECPLCGTPGAIDEGWAARTTAAIVDLRDRSQGLRDARTALRRALDGIHALFTPQTPEILDRASEAGIDTHTARSAWAAFAEFLRGDAAELVERGAPAACALAAALNDARAAAVVAQDEHARRWRPVQEALLGWAGVARLAERDRRLVALLRAAEAWMGETMARLRRERLAPVVEGAQENWDELRHESNVALGDVELRKQGNVRFAAFEVSIDGEDASAFGVMSQGELSALAISVFLPRATLPGNPFGFMLIDDPVQSMDPAKVDGLARVLGRAGRARQVIVLTHDARLPEAVRRLDVAARIVRVQRRARSKVEIVAAQAPGDRYLGEAFAIAKAETMLPEVRARVVPGFCRSAIEAACETRIRRRLVQDGRPHAEIDERVASLTSLNAHLADALGLSIAQGREIREAVRRLAGDDAVEAVDVARKGAHQLLEIDGLHLVEGTKRLVRALADNA